MTKLIKTTSAMVALAGSLLVVSQFGLISVRDAVGLFIILLVLSICLTIQLEERFKPLENKIGQIEDFLMQLCTVFETRGKLENIRPYSRRSPLTVTQQGMEILAKMKLKQGIDANLDYLFERIDRTNPKTAFDVEQFCIGLINYFFMGGDDRGIFTETDHFLYENPDYNDSELFKTAGLYLRDKYLEKHPELVEQS